jgi:hypothetical protein
MWLSRDSCAALLRGGKITAVPAGTRGGPVQGPQVADIAVGTLPSRNLTHRRRLIRGPNTLTSQCTRSIQIVRYISADIYSRGGWRRALCRDTLGIVSSAERSLVDLFLVKGKTHNTFEGYVKQLASIS